MKTDSITLSYQKYMSQQLVAEEQMESFTASYDIMFRALRLQLTRYVLSQEAESKELSWPSDWWQAFRQRWFPKRWLKRHPVKMERKRLVAMATYPNLIHPPGQRPVVKFIVQDQSHIWNDE